MAEFDDQITGRVKEFRKEARYQGLAKQKK